MKYIIIFLKNITLKPYYIIKFKWIKHLYRQAMKELDKLKRERINFDKKMEKELKLFKYLEKDQTLDEDIFKESNIMFEMWKVRKEEWKKEFKELGR